MFPHPDMGKDLYRPFNTEQIRCGWQAAITLAIVMAGATLFDLATAQAPGYSAVVAAAQEGGL